jgi:hypothetical protein
MLQKKSFMGSAPAPDHHPRGNVKNFFVADERQNKLGRLSLENF